ncbi:protein of unknown function [Streptomyces sp. KY75]|nr:protein of unknown function [Streptomyces sp. KY70]CAD5989993.1 protein of unknown function [Streptomyces sp. KY75]
MPGDARRCPEKPGDARRRQKAMSWSALQGNLSRLFTDVPRVRGVMRTVTVVDRSGAKHDRLSRFTAMVLPRRTEGLTFSIHAPIYVRRKRVEAL